MTLEEPCLMCGGSIVADHNPSAIHEAVLRHVMSERHQRSRKRKPTRTCPDCRMVTIPAWRDRCHGCRRTLELVT